MYFFMLLFLCRSILAAPEMIPIDDTDILGKTAPVFDLQTLDKKYKNWKIYEENPLFYLFGPVGVLLVDMNCQN